MRGYKIWRTLALINIFTITSRAYRFLSNEESNYENYDQGSGYEDPTNGYDVIMEHYDWYGEPQDCYPKICNSENPMCCRDPSGRNRCCSRIEYYYLHNKMEPMKCVGSFNIYYTGVSCPSDPRTPERYLCCRQGTKCCTSKEYDYYNKKSDKPPPTPTDHNAKASFQGRMVGIVTIIVVMTGAAIAVVSRFVKSRKNRRLNISRPEAGPTTTSVPDPPPPYVVPSTQDGETGIYNTGYNQWPEILIEDSPPEYGDVINAPPAYVTDYESSAESTTSKPS